MKTKLLRISTLLFTAVIAATLGCFASYYYLNSKLTAGNNSVQDTHDFISKVLKLDELVRGRFIGSLNDSSLVDGMIKGYIGSLGDNYSAYIPKSGYKSYQKYLSDGTVASSGIIAQPDADALRVITVMKSSPAWRAGLQPGDMIKSVNGSTVADAGAYPSLGRLVLAEGSSADITWTRGGLSYSATIAYNVDFHTKSLTYSAFSAGSGNIAADEGFSSDTAVLYICIKYFASDTATLLADALADPSCQGLPIIFDIRNNCGGSVDALKETVDMLVPTGILFSIESAAEGSETDDSSIVYYSDQNEVAVPMAVLVNEYTSREAEVFALIIREYEKGSIIGSKTAGIGMIQSFVDLGDETAFCLTTRRYVLPKGSVFNGSGITPTVAVDSGSTDLDRLLIKNDAQLLAALKNAGLIYKEAEIVLPEPPTDAI